MYVLTYYDISEETADTINNKIYKNFESAYNDMLDNLVEGLELEEINYFDIVKTGGIEYHHRNETPTEISGLFICTIVNYDYNSNAYINITHVVGNNGTLKNGG